MSDELEPLAPHEAVQMYLDSRRDDLAASTLQSQEYRLEAFIEWADEKEIENLNDLTGRDLYAYRVWRREGKGGKRAAIKPVTLRGQLATVKAFLRFAGEIEAVPKDLHDKVPLPTLDGAEDVSESTLEPERAEAIIDYLGRYEYASSNHIILLLLWRTGCRTGGLRALDLQDVDLEGDHPAVSGPAVRFVHRPETDTPLKNKERGNRWNRIGNHVAKVLADYIDGPRHDVTDEYDREPLLTTTNGRASASSVRATLYRVTRPCWRDAGCPHDKNPETCEYTELSKASQCPSARSPHDARSGRVTYYRQNDTPRRVVQDRLDASEDVLDKHYDRRSERQRAEQRTEHLPDL
ncbi:tyrosine-type recombinase/integrase [Haloarchaeobius iranensis]|uniref:Phage integrase family protein n=1 Tax=Haloarchaeobius iranensis TaxID=996166 RepID=A0A1H0B957_9EURY|nr:site-specific integrase [Haloarchaeobius iranensis]SDN41883.1 Phage integrase family protein [Haloarchaeobius iranensis]